MSFSPRQIATIVTRLALVLALGLAPWPGVRAAWSAGFRAIANVVLAGFSCDTIYGAGTAQLVPAAKPSPDGPTWDTTLRVRVQRVPNTDEVVVNPRRTAYIPLVVFLAVVFAMPLSAGARWRCVGFGVPGLLLLSSFEMWIMSLWLFAQIPGLMVDQSFLVQGAIDLGYRALVVPLGNRYIIPLLFALPLAAMSGRAARPRTSHVR